VAEPGLAFNNSDFEIEERKNFPKQIKYGGGVFG
jgi:hypothetical protein